MRIAILLFLVTLASGCDSAQNDEPKTIYGFWRDLDSGLEEYQTVDSTTATLYSLDYSDRTCFNKSVSTVTLATDTRVEITSPPYGVRSILALDSTDTDRMASFTGGIIFQYARVGQGDRSRREVERSVCAS